MNFEYKIRVKLAKRSYPIYFGTDIYHSLPELIGKSGANKQVAVISALPVAKYYLQPVTESFGNDWQIKTMIVPDGESSKSLAVAENLFTQLIETKFERNCTVVALGGGVVGDLAGFVAATFLRGVNLVHLPTSLLAQVDSSIGGKAGVNHPMGKNLIGAFYQPKFILTDTNVLRTLPDDEFLSGMGEVLKYALIHPGPLFDLLENHFDSFRNKDEKILNDVIRMCASIKAEVVSKDEKESGLRAILNFGHTFGHALETYYNFKGLKHGFSVVLGMHCALRASRILGLISESQADRAQELLLKTNISLPENTLPSVDKLIEIMTGDKKVKSGKLHLVLLKNIGHPTIQKVDEINLIRESFSAIFATAMTQDH